MEPIEIPGIQLVEEIGHGAYSVVYRARRGDMLLAVKIHHQRREEGAVRRFRREAAALARVRCPGLVAILDVGEAEGRPYLIMEHIAGRTLAQVIEEGPLPEQRLVDIARRLANTLAEVHRHGVVHRDIKPANIILTEEGDVRLIDFGLATRMASEIGTEEAVGTFVYSAPEQTGMLKCPVDGRTDLYALGVVLFECATGVPPFRSDDSGDLMRMHALMPAPRARATGRALTHDQRTAISPALDAIIAKLLAKDPDDRYQSAAGLRADLDALERLNDTLGRQEPLRLDVVSTRPLPEDAVPFVGRETELATLRARLLETCRGHGSVALVEGEAGVGKRPAAPSAPPRGPSLGGAGAALRHLPRTRAARRAALRLRRVPARPRAERVPDAGGAPRADAQGGRRSRPLGGTARTARVYGHRRDPGAARGGRGAGPHAGGPGTLHRGAGSPLPGRGPGGR